MQWEEWCGLAAQADETSGWRVMKVHMYKTQRDWCLWYVYQHTDTHDSTVDVLSSRHGTLTWHSPYIWLEATTRWRPVSLEIKRDWSVYCTWWRRSGRSREQRVTERVAEMCVAASRIMRRPRDAAESGHSSSPSTDSDLLPDRSRSRERKVRRTGSYGPDRARSSAASSRARR